MYIVYVVVPRAVGAPITQILGVRSLGCFLVEYSQHDPRGWWQGANVQPKHVYRMRTNICGGIISWLELQFLPSVKGRSITCSKVTMSTLENSSTAFSTQFYNNLRVPLRYVMVPLKTNNGFYSFCLSILQILTSTVLGLVILCAITYLFTSFRFSLTSGLNSRFKGNEPPTLPYWIPWVGNAWSMVTDPHKFYEETLYVHISLFCTTTT